MTSASNVSVAYTKIGECRHTDFATENNECADSKQPYLTMPHELNTLKITVLDNFGSPILHGLDVTATFEVLTGNAQTAMDMINYTTTRTGPSADLPSFGVYFVNFNFNALEEFEYKVTVHVGNLSNTVQQLTPVRYMYALHQPVLDPTCLKNNFVDATSAVYVDAPYDIHCAVSLNSSACADLNCIQMYGGNTGNSSDVTRQRCALSGCMYRASETKNRVVWMVEKGFWHRYNGYNEAWDPQHQTERAFSIEMSVSQVDITCATDISGPSESDDIHNSSCLAERTVYWRECDTANSSSIIASTKKTIPAIRGGSGDVNNPDADRFIVEFDVAEPGTYWLTATLAVEEDPRAIVLRPHVEVIIGPGGLHVKGSPLLQPNLTEPARRPDKPMQLQNPRGGPQSSTGGAMTTWVQYNLTLAAKDDRGNPRDSSDEMFVVIQHQMDDLKESADAQQTALSASAGFFSQCYATDGLIKRMKNMDRNQWPLEVGDAKTVCKNKDILPIVPGPVCDKHQAGIYTLLATFDNAYGVFKLNTWVCDGTQVHGQAGWDLSSCVGSNDNAPQFWGIYRGNNDANDLHNMPMSFTVCPANSATSSGKWGSTGFAEGPVLNTCQCQAGYMGRKGEACAACPNGKFTQTQGAPVCVDCPIGKFCSCATSGNCGDGGQLPACRVCQDCPAGKYQRLAAQSICTPCPAEGFNCQYTGLTYPVAFEGMFIDPKDSEKVHKCTFGDDAGTARLNNGTRLASQGQLSMDAAGKVAHLKVTPNSELGADIRGNSCPGGDISLARELKCYLDDNLELVSDTFPGPEGSHKCFRAVGALCLEGYSGEGGAACSKCCKQSEPGCSASWYKNTANSNTVCLKCEETNGSLLVAGAMIIGLVLAPLVLKLAEAMKHAGALQGPVMR